MATISQQDMKSALPDTTSSLNISGLDSDIEIYRDQWGIPHVYAQTTHDAFFGQGFVTAQDRLWHMDYDRRRAYGRWAEFAGKAAIEQDMMMRRFSLGATVKGDYEATNEDARAMLDAYAAGVNAFIETTNTLPVEYSIVGGKPEPWQPWDCIAVFKVRHILMGVFEGKLWRARLARELGQEKAASLLKGYEPGHLVITPPGAVYDGPELDALDELAKGLEHLGWLQDTPESGSNNWVVSGSRAASGKPLLAGDPHRPLDTPNVYYQNHISSPEFDVVGLSFPGCPGFPHFGHNARVAWAVTHAQADYQDLFIEKFNPNDPTKYEFKGQWKQAEVRHEVIKVRDGEDIQQDVTVTDHGPIIAGDPMRDYATAFRYTATAEPNRLAEPLLDMLLAKSTDEMDEAMREWVDPCNNFVFADMDGNIEYLNRGKVPIRSMSNAWLPVPGWTGEHEWQGVIPFDELPRSKNPETGYIVTANNRIPGKDYPYYIALDFAPEFRARRILERLEGMTDGTIEDMSSIHAERVSIPAQAYIKLLANIEPQDAFSVKAREVLVGWDGSIERDGVAPTIYNAFRLLLHTKIIGHLFGSLSDEAFKAGGRGAPAHVARLGARLVSHMLNEDTSLLPPKSDWKKLAEQTLSEAVSDLRHRLGDNMDEWQWGKIHYTKPQHTLSASFPELASLLDPPSIPMGGDGDTPQAGGYSPANPFVITGLSVSRYAFDLGDWENSRWIVPLGSSGHPGSQHYADQAPIWGEVNMIPMLYDWEKVRAEAESEQKLSRG